MPYKEGMDLDGTARHKHEGKDPPYSNQNLESRLQAAFHMVPHMNAESNTNQKVGQASSHKNKHTESPLMTKAAQIDNLGTAS